MCSFPPCSYRMSDHSLQFLRYHTPRIRQIDLMMPSLIRKVILIAVFGQILIHQGNRRRFIIIRADMHALDAKSLFDSQEFHL